MAESVNARYGASGSYVTVDKVYYDPAVVSRKGACERADPTRVGV